MKHSAKTSSLIRAGLLAGLAMGATSALATGVSVPGSKPQAPWLLAQAAADEEPIFGSQLMTEEERIDYRARWRAARTDDERAKLRSDHHERMKDRARERGVTLAEEPPARGAGMGPGSGSGMGPGPGGGAGPGPGGGAGPGGGGGPGPGPGR